jgi:S1-C subfamily serine protease
MKLERAVWIPALAACLAALIGLTAARAQTPAAAPGSLEAQASVLKRAADSVVGLRANAVEDARSARSLGPKRSGSGVVIGNDGLVLTIGYLILEAETVELITDDGREIPARVIAYDLATGFGLVQTLVPLKIEPVPLGLAASVSGDEPLMIVSGGDGGAISVAKLVVQRPFSGYWEYHLENALFTTPPRSDHSGAGLFNGRGELIGVGSLFVSETRAQAAAAGGRIPGNMFVPIDLLKPVIADLRARGASRESERAWLGINCTESDGAVRITRISEDSPADVADLRAGDAIVAIDGTAVTELAVLWKTLWAGGRPEREVTLSIVRGGESLSVKVQSVDRMKTLRRSQGV